MAAVVTVSDSDVSVVNEDRIGESAAVIPVSDSDESVVDENGIGKNLSKEDWKRLLENDWLTDKVSVYLELKSDRHFIPCCTCNIHTDYPQLLRTAEGTS